MSALIEKAGPEARLCDLGNRLAEILAGVNALLALEVPTSEDLSNHGVSGVAVDTHRTALEWVGEALRRQVTDALNVAVGDAEPEA